MRIELSGCNNPEERERIKDGIPAILTNEKARILFRQKFPRIRRSFTKNLLYILDGASLVCGIEGKNRSFIRKNINLVQDGGQGAKVIKVDCQDRGCPFNSNYVRHSWVGKLIPFLGRLLS